MATTWKPHTAHGTLDSSARNDLPDSVFAFPTKRKEPLTDASHVRNALARFDQVEDVTDAEREQAFANIRAAARHFDVHIEESSWHDLMPKAQQKRTSSKGASASSASSSRSSHKAGHSG